MDSWVYSFNETNPKEFSWDRVIFHVQYGSIFVDIQDASEEVVKVLVKDFPGVDTYHEQVHVAREHIPVFIGVLGRVWHRRYMSNVDDAQTIVDLLCEYLGFVDSINNLPADEFPFHMIESGMPLSYGLDNSFTIGERLFKGMAVTYRIGRELWDKDQEFVEVGIRIQDRTNAEESETLDKFVVGKGQVFEFIQDWRSLHIPMIHRWKDEKEGLEQAFAIAVDHQKEQAKLYLEGKSYIALEERV